MFSSSLSRWLLPVALIGTVGASGVALGLTSEQISSIHAKLQNSRRAKSAATVVSPSVAKRIETAIVAAQNLLGRIYDQTMGCDNGRNYAAGQIVCVDVPRLALLDAGVSLAEILKEDARLHPGRYPKEKSGDNLPEHPNFSRRTRNWMRWCQGHGRLMPPTATPKPGDVVFYGPIHIAFVYGVDPDGHYRIVECAPSTGRCLEQYDWMMDLRGWKPTGFGRILPLPAEFTRLLTPAKKVIAMTPDPKWTIDRQIESHPGMGMMAGIFSRLQGKPLPKSLIESGKIASKAGSSKPLAVQAAQIAAGANARTRVAINVRSSKKAAAQPAVEDVPAEQKAYLLAELSPEAVAARAQAAANAPALEKKPVTKKKTVAAKGKKPSKPAAKAKAKSKAVHKPKAAEAAKKSAAD